MEAYTREAFRMFGSRPSEEVSLLCEPDAMRALVDRFVPEVSASVLGDRRILAEVRVCPSPIFYQWVFGWEGRSCILGLENIHLEYRDMLRDVRESSRARPEA